MIILSLLKKFGGKNNLSQTQIIIKVFYIWLMAKTIESLFYWLTFVSDFILLVFSVFLIRKNKDLGVVWLIIIYTLVNLSINFTFELYRSNIIFFIYSCFTFLEYALFTSFIFSFIKSPGFKKIIIGTSVLYSLFLPIYHTTFEFGGSIDSIPIGVETLLILLFCFYYFYEQMNDLDNHYIYNRYHFWIIIGMMLYLAGSFFIYIFANQVNKDTQRQFWFLTYFFYVVKDLFFLIGLMNYKKGTKTQSLKELYPYLN
jgi:hypothetical protein